MSKIVYAKVSGSLSFPIDMLRYDCCSPATEEDSNKISRTFDVRSSSWEVFIKKVLITKINKNQSAFTTGRWKSFGCDIVEVKTPYEKV